MSNTNNGGPAFPEQGGYVAGMTLRDYFAAKAMQAHITASLAALSKTYSSNVYAINPIIASAAYEVADAMLKARVE